MSGSEKTRMHNGRFLNLLAPSLEHLDAAFPAATQDPADVSPADVSPADLSPADASPAPAELAVLKEVAQRLTDNYPYFHPLYAGQMLKPPHPVARAAYAMAMGLNPNNHALDGGRASSRMEVEAVAAIARMFGWPDHLGHLTSGGTFANLEALWVAGKQAPAGAILASDQAHYTHERISAVLRLPFESIASNDRGSMDITALQARLQQAESGERRPVGAVVVTLGTTATGSVDPLEQVLALRQRYGFRVHVDAAYGGYFTLSSTLQTNTRHSFDRAKDADSIVIDPHKHGLQPYGCGCVLFRDPRVAGLYRHDSPYTYFSAPGSRSELHLGEITLECSRAGAAAVALWATQQVMPMTPGGAFARDLDRCRAAAMDLHRRLNGHADFVTAFPPELDIVVWAVRADTIQAASERAQRIFDEAAKLGLHLALADLPVRFFAPGVWPDSAGASTVRCLRSVLMKPEHAEWVPELYRLLQQATQTALSR